jgi:hypothetical protein
VTPNLSLNPGGSEQAATAHLHRTSKANRTRGKKQQQIIVMINIGQISSKTKRWFKKNAVYIM